MRSLRKEADAALIRGSCSLILRGGKNRTQVAYGGLMRACCSRSQGQKVMEGVVGFANNEGAGAPRQGRQIPQLRGSSLDSDELQSQIAEVQQI